jgi:nuclear transport factor 2 (NTF2) superfamily protein
LKACRDLPDTAADRICRVDAPSSICHTVVPGELQGQDMTTDQSIRQLTFIDAETVLERAQRLLNAGDISEVMKTFASDVVVRFADFPETYGRPPLEAFLRARFARQRNYRLQKQLRAVSGNVIVCYWDAEWDDGQNGHKMEGRGIELLTMRADEIAKWEATFNVWSKGDAPSLPIV